ncbi:siderophore ABC transporter substrate-binding protein [Neobacillus thermocopriae]|uniref:Siderophore ABC transporter substrate-binding protein n=1 Tax=Neobacillus thermocopriae TaxID=1215031 RepID=A0A6B3TLR1_9BACI|nr:siderophore ABC transporter substrate-binding protein [Neobacillus thermocopriae]MED3622624.1 siderophore ABC transporter substrate-binding protein [Neobacillus thermocopriae]MED3714285.1 siderophore ABC transporter substrate-binding protein [Neobacillus thermocopriae]NEX77823.1 siderophore ABC transporter substrate-binding protein [Neobacillus thermocopriae]
MKKWSLLGIIFSIILVLAACGGAKETSQQEKSSGSKGSETTEAKEVTIQHKFGEVVVKKNPEKVVVFDFGVLDTLDELGVEVAGVPQAMIPSYLEKYADKKYTNVGSLKEPDFEAIHALQPDVIFISARQAELYDQFAEIAPTVFIELDFTKYMESFEKNMNLIGQIFGKEEKVASELKEIKANIEKLNKKATSANQKGLIVLTNEGKVSAFGPNSRYGFVHDVFGFGAVDKDIEVSTHGQVVTFEYIMEKNPDVLFVIDRNVAVGGEAGAKKTIENELVQKTNAYKNNKIVYLDANTWYLSGGGLKSIKLMAEEIEAAL